jgi:cellulose synthase/poly-beta-1,6-N-acetylglucosamine synthase-like glycosyltransferase
MLISLANGLLLLLELALSLEVGYLVLLTIAAFFASRRTPQRGGKPTNRFVILVPAHNEELLIERTVGSLLRLEYPRELMSVLVIADNCTDRTAELAARAGASVLERTNPDQRGKGYALDYALAHLWETQQTVDGIVIVDADTDVSPNFLTVMDARLAHGERAVQAYYAVRDPDRSWSIALRYAALAVLHYLRPQGRMTLGGSVGLKGNGMMFAADIMRQQRWSASITEDVELHMRLVLAGERVMFAPDAVVWAEMPNTLKDSASQNTRWERGRVQTLRSYAPTLLRQALARRSFILLDACIEQMIPPTSLLVLVNGICLIAGIFAGRVTFLIALADLIGMVFYILAGLAFAHAPRKVYLAMLYAPVMVLWKTWVYLRVLLSPDRQGWVRTTRNTKGSAG